VVASLTLAALAIPLASIYRVAPGWPRRSMIAVSVLLLGLAISGTVWLLATPGEDNGAALLGLALFGTFASTWAANFLAMARPKR
jgi:hypothetical protein